MPFRDSNTIQPLFDIRDGGAPRAFECRLSRYPTVFDPCGFVARSLRGVISHQQQVHDVNPVLDIFKEDKR